MKFTHSSHLRRGLLSLVILLMGISVARLLVSMHQQHERIQILEGQVAQLLADTTRLRIPAYTPPRGLPFQSSAERYSAHTSGYRRSHRPYAAANVSGAYAVSPDTFPSGSSVSVPATAPDGSTSIPDAYPSATATTPLKFTTPHLFDLNTIDSLTLIRIPGIAARTASVILQHRQRYGGFYDPRQLQEFLTWPAALDYMDEWCTLWFSADASRLRHIAVNSATISQLQRHPYISHEQAVELFRYRARHPHIASLDELLQLTTFTQAQLGQLAPYLSFE